MTFGGRASPSAWEAHSSAIEKCYNREPCAEQPDPAQLARFVDDMQLAIAMTTHHGGKSGTQRLKSVIEKVANKDALNGEKTVVHTLTNNFGAMIDTTLRKVSTPWSKILKFGHAVQPLISGESKTLNLGQIHSIIGLSAYILGLAPQLLPVLAPRLTAVSSRAAVDEMIHGRRPRNNQVFSPKIGNESDAEGWKNLKKSLDIVWRLVLWRQGKLLNRTYEASLPMEERLLFPGRETSSVVRLMHMDASGKAMFCFDETSGRHCSPKQNKSSSTHSRMRTQRTSLSAS